MLSSNRDRRGLKGVVNLFQHCGPGNRGPGRQSLILIAVVLEGLLPVLWTSLATAQTGRQTPVPPAPQPDQLIPDNPWTPNQLQRAMVTGTDMPIVEPLPFWSLKPLPEPASPVPSGDGTGSMPDSQPDSQTTPNPDLKHQQLTD